MKIGVLGASGVVGQRLVPLLRQQGHRVRGLLHTLNRCPHVDESCFVDLLQEPTLREALLGLDALVNLATSIPANGGRGTWAANDRIRIEGSRCLLRALTETAPGCRLVQQSVAMLHKGRKLADETGELTGQGVLASALVMEATVQGSDLDWVIVRGGALYGAGTARDLRYFGRLSSGELRPPENAKRWISLIHIDDLASAFSRAVYLPGRQAYIAADDQPLTYTELVRGFSGARRKVLAHAETMSTLPSFRVTNRRLREGGWMPTYPNVFTANHSLILGTAAVEGTAS